MKQARDYRKYNLRLTSADWQRGSGRVINYTPAKRFTHADLCVLSIPVLAFILEQHRYELCYFW